MIDRCASRSSFVAALLGLAALLPVQASGQPLSPVQLPAHPDKPTWSILETVYSCPDGERRFSVRYDYAPNAEISFLRGVRKGVELPAAEVEQATQALRQLDAVSTFIPECSEQFDSIMAVGRLGDDRAFVALVWQDNHLQVSTPQLLGD